MSLDDQFLELESVFKELDSRIDLKTNTVNRLFNLDLSSINSKFNNENGLKAHENYLNKHRESLLNQLIAKRDAQLNEVNDLVRNQFNNDILNDYEFRRRNWLISQIHNSIKNNFICFNKSNTICLESVLNRYDFSMPFDLRKMIKYSNFLVTRKEFKLNLDDETFKAPIYDQFDFLSLPSNKLFVYTQREIDNLTKMLVIDQHGAILHSKTLVQENGDFLEDIFHLTSNSIVRLFQNEDDAIDKFSNVEIYSFKLELLRSFKFKREFFYDIVINNDEFGFKSVLNSKILIYDNCRSKLNYINLNLDENDIVFKTHNTLRLINLSKENFYFLKRNSQSKYEMLFIVDRKRGVKTASIQIKPRYLFLSVRFDKKSQIYDVDDDYFVNVYGANGNLLYNIEPGLHLFNDFLFTNRNNLLFYISSIENFISFDEY